MFRSPAYPERTFDSTLLVNGLSGQLYASAGKFPPDCLKLGKAGSVNPSEVSSDRFRPSSQRQMASTLQDILFGQRNHVQ